ncbi:MAG: FMN-binding protein [SAR324 cluster bacterium]|nr:FMN-binding protein [SAR324 cluster bacterium]
MKKSLNIVLVLTLITAFSGAFLAYWDRHTGPFIAENKRIELEKAIASVLPTHDAYTTRLIDRRTYYIATNKGEPVGTCFRVLGPGFQGNIAIMVGVKPDLTEITGIKTLEQIETPGLGTKIITDPANKEDPRWFPKQFVGLVIDKAITVLKNKKAVGPHQITAITGATITSKAVAKIISKGVSKYRQEWEEHVLGKED